MQVTLRIPPAMIELIQREAAKSSRSQHAELLHRLALGLGDAALLQSAGEGESIVDRMAADIRALRELAELFAARAMP